jgi:hypothetical protein
MTKAEAQVKNDLMLRLSGVDLFHSKGFKGEGLIVAVLETADSEHSKMVTKAFKVSLPNAKYLCLDATEENFMKCSRDKVDIINVSMGFMNKAGSEYYVKNGGILVGATGNKEVADFSGWEHVIDVGALWETMQIATYSAKSPTLDIVSFVPYIEGSEDYWFQPDGTSFASPFLAGVIGCLIQYWKSIGYKYTPQSVKEYLFKHAVDILEVGRDNASGQGYARIDFMKTIKLEIGGKAYVNGIDTPIDVPAQIINGRTVVPARFIAENLGCEVSFKTDANKKVTEVTIIQDTIT